MLTLVDITNVRGDTLHLPMLDSSAGYIVKDIEGLDPVKAVLTSSSMAQVDGVQPQNARRDLRNITMKLGFDPDFVSNTVQSLRTGLYDYFMPKDNILLGFYIDGQIYAVIAGQVEDFNNSMFSADPEVDISILCYDPDFQGPAEVTLTSATVSDTNTNVVNYEGNSDTGVIFTLNVDGLVTNFALYNTTPDNEIQSFILNGSFTIDDVVTINTNPGQRGITLTRGGVVSSILYDLDPTSDWITLMKGENQFRAYSPGSAIPYTLTYVPKYGGL
jgi:hypothetical protein